MDSGKNQLNVNFAFNMLTGNKTLFSFSLHNSKTKVRIITVEDKIGGHYLFSALTSTAIIYVPYKYYSTDLTV